MGGLATCGPAQGARLNLYRLSFRWKSSSELSKHSQARGSAVPRRGPGREHHCPGAVETQVAE